MDCIAVTPHRNNYPDPIRLKTGDTVALGRKDDQYPGWIWITTACGDEGWAPESLIRIETKDSGVATSAYTARELDTHAGERLACKSELGGWLWVENEKGQSGWVPKDSVRAI